MVTAVMKLKNACTLEDQPRQHIKKQRHYFAKKVASNQSYGFPSSHVWMWELDAKESWGLKNWCFWTVAAAAAKSLQLCPTLCDPIDSSPPGSPVPGILQARVLEWVAISSSNAWKWKVKEKLLSCVRLVATPWTAAHQALPSMGFSRQEYWNGVPLLLNCGVGENSWESLGLQGDQTSPS